MWQNVDFDSSDINFKYKSEDGFLYVQCTASNDKLSGGKVYLYTDTIGQDSAFCLGSLSESNGNAALDKSYSHSFLHSQHIDPAAALYFFILASDGDTVLYSHTDQTDSSLLRAQKLLQSMSQGKDYSRQASACIKQIHSTLATLPRASFGILQGFDWYEITDIKTTFSISSVEHIVFSREFVQSFVQSGKWYFGTCADPRIYAISVQKSDGIPNPMSNANDCVIQTDLPQGVFLTVGIGLYDDGQYFCRIHSQKS